MRLVPFSRHHAPYVVEGGPAEGGEIMQMLDRPTLDALERENSWTLLDDAGTPVACGGTVRQWGTRYACWTYLNAASGRYMVSITRAARRVLKGAGPGRFEMDVRADFAAGQHWAQILGFEVETPSKPGFGLAGEEFIGYVRFQE